MKKRNIITLLAVSAMFATGVTTSQIADASTMRLTHNAYVYNAKGKKTKSKLLRKGKTVKATKLKKIKGKYYWKIGKNKYVRKGNVGKITKKHKKDNQIYKPQVTKNTDINLDNNPSLPDAKSVITNANSLPTGTKYSWDKDETPEFKADGNTEGQVNIVYPDGSKDSVEIDYVYHGTDHIKMPKTYTLSGLKEADNAPTAQMNKASEEGMKNNNFVSESAQDDKEKINALNLTTAQKQEISKFALRLINEARNQLGQSSWYYDNNVQSLADDIATKYQKDGRGVQDGDHYVSGIVEVAAQHGYDLDGINQLEDLFGDTSDKPKTMTDMKSLVYDGITSFLFNTQEYHHAADILSGHSDDDWNSHLQDRPFAVSYSRVGDWNSVHYIRIPSNVE